MCEPTHSIVQYPPDDDQGNPTEGRLAKGLKKLMGIVKKIGGWFHLSKFGYGHHEAQDWAAIDHHVLPPHTKFEGDWTTRTVAFDGSYLGTSRPGWFSDDGLLKRAEVRESELKAHEAATKMSADMALEAATAYSRIVVLDSLSSLRRFLQTSLEQTDRPGAYLGCALNGLGSTGFVPLFNKKGVDHVRHRLVQILSRFLDNNIDDIKFSSVNGVGTVTSHAFWDNLILRQMMDTRPAEVRSYNELKKMRAEAKRSVKKQTVWKTVLDLCIKVLLGTTRQRRFMNDAWADDAKLWTPDATQVERPKILLA